jgi:glycosyltransferase involved in cell wall biosynthesis
MRGFIQQQHKRLMPNQRHYRFGFVLSTGAGNRTRYENLRKYAEREPSVTCMWAINPGNVEPPPPAWLPEALHCRWAAFSTAAPVLSRLGSFDAVMFHAFEPYVLAAVRNVFRPRPALVWSKDDPPTADPRFWWHYHERQRTAARARLRFEVDRWCARRVKLFVPFSEWVAEGLVRKGGVPADRVLTLNVGIDLERWRFEPHCALGPPKILFVGGDFGRKGGDLLVDVFRRRFATRAELHAVSTGAPPTLPADVRVYRNFAPNDEGLRRLFDEAAMLVLPTRSDFVPNVILEAMASGIPVVSTSVGGIPDLVVHGETGWLVPVDDGNALAGAMDSLLSDAGLRQRMGAAGRARVEARFNAAINVPRILSAMMTAADATGCVSGVKA